MRDYRKGLDRGVHFPNMVWCIWGTLAVADSLGDLSDQIKLSFTYTGKSPVNMMHQLCNSADNGALSLSQVASQVIQFKSKYEAQKQFYDLHDPKMGDLWPYARILTPHLLELLENRKYSDLHLAERTTTAREILGFSKSNFKVSNHKPTSPALIKERNILRQKKKNPHVHI